MFLITTRNFPPDVGGMQFLMFGIAKNLVRHGPVQVFADDFKNSNDFDNSLDFGVNRIKGIKFLAKYRKVSQIQNFVSSKNNPRAIISDHWKSIEKLPLNFCSKHKILCLIHGKEINHPIGSPIHTRMINSLNKSFKIIANSNFTKNLAIEKKIASNKIEVINPGIDLNHSIHESDLKNAKKIIKNNTPIIVTIARLEQRKSIDKVLLSIKNLKSKYESLKYIILGDGDEYKNLNKIVSNLKLNDTVDFIQDASQGLKNAILKSSNIFVMPSIQRGRSVEGFGIVFLEAAKYGVPSIGGIKGGAADIIKNGETGFLCDGEQQSEIYNALLKMLDGDKYIEMGKSAEIYSKEFSWENQIKKIINLINERK